MQLFDSTVGVHIQVAVGNIFIREVMVLHAIFYDGGDRCALVTENWEKCGGMYCTLLKGSPG